MNKQKMYGKITEELQHILSVTDLYDFDQNKEHIRIVLVPAKSNQELLKALPHILFDCAEYAGVFSLELFHDKGFSFGYYITHAHLTLWNTTEDDLFRLATGTPIPRLGQ